MSIDDTELPGVLRPGTLHAINKKDNYQDNDGNIRVILEPVESNLEGVQKVISVLPEALPSVTSPIQKDPRFYGLTSRFIFLRLKPEEIHLLSDKSRELKLRYIWPDPPVRALLWETVKTVGADSGSVTNSGDLGKGVKWALIDTGVNSTHLHFNPSSSKLVEAQFDLIGVSQLDPTDLTSWDQYKHTSGSQYQLDEEGHGTHIAGIITGEGTAHVTQEDGSASNVTLCGIAPQTTLISFRALQRANRRDAPDLNSGNTSTVIACLEYLHQYYIQNQRLLVDGVNLSLAAEMVGQLDPSIGRSPICVAVDDLYSDGYFVVVAAGNFGHEPAGISPLGHAFLEISMLDPANAFDGFVVGSCHRTNPKKFGVSFFSSRGPTADGREKPDLVAPGEDILAPCSETSDYHKNKCQGIQHHHRRMSGTSQATAVVSGVAAAVLSKFPTHKGDPKWLIEQLKASATPMEGRASSHCGEGIVNLARAIQTLEGVP